MKEQTDFTKKVLSLIKKIPKGRVATYSQIAKLAGKPQGVRGVVWILHSQSESNSLPWHRVINAKGKISFPEMTPQNIRQQGLLKKEGIEFGEAEIIDLKIHQWKPKK